MEYPEVKKILVTGGAGFIGSCLCLKLKALGFEVTAFDNLSPQVHGAIGNAATYGNIKDQITFCHGDIRDKRAVEQVIAGQEVIVHLAAETGTGQSMYEPDHYTDVNVTGTAVLLAAIARQNNPLLKFVLASSRAIYGEGAYKCPKHGSMYPDSRWPEDLSQGLFEPFCPVCGSTLVCIPTAEDAALKPGSVYAMTKLAQEQLVQIFAAAKGFPAVILRYQNVYGPGQSLANPYTGILSIFSQRLRRNEPINIFEDGNESRDFVFVDDVVQATVLAVTSRISGVKIFNVGAGQLTTVNQVAELLKQAYKSTSEISVSGNFRAGDIRHNFADVSRIGQALGFKPSISFTEGIGRFATWARGQDLPPDSYELSLKELRAKGLLH